MDLQSRALSSGTPTRLQSGDSTTLPTIDSAELMRGGRELLIRHGESTYRLRVTMSEKLILTK
jgi:hemin uptake protein HemP